MLRDIADMDRIIAQLEPGASSAVIGGGSYIGLELAEAFRARRLQTTVVERTDRLMPWLDPEMTRILDYHIDTHDVDVSLPDATGAGVVTRRAASRRANLARAGGIGGIGGKVKPFASP